ncbi:MAG: aromatic ring-hydroxylating dioxygenase subunit alpha [bacterium]|nr:aromatic ring-hydroxylating dioxygenase subunit alpha [bacterium]MDE0239969.1 aromatic ring-hydroxylating dioxygenase subunit alpha [bacterium]MDE0416146.1 aromatic ring-hydroxylating dioxygenase subunit alpha [bacterium]
MNDNLFDPHRYEATRRPLLEAETLPGECYTSEDFFRREVKTIFMKCWNFIGREDRVPEPGCYFSLDFVGVPVVIVRGRDSRVRAFANTCRHRGARVVSGEGRCHTFSCPYHAWTYAVDDGRLIGAMDMDETAGFDRKDFGLIELNLEIWAGFMFLNFDSEAEPLESWLGDLPQILAPYDLDAMVTTRRVTYDLDCNWKVYVENAMESYHVPTVHQQTIQKQKRDHNPPIPAHGQYCGLFTRHKGSRALLEGMKGFPHIPTLEGRSAEGTHYILLYPSTMFGLTYDCMWWLELHPLSAGKTRLIVGSCFPESTARRGDFAELAPNYYERWNQSIVEDNDVSNLQQIGLGSPFVAPGRFSHLEPLVHAIDNWVLDRVLDP